MQPTLNGFNDSDLAGDVDGSYRKISSSLVEYIAAASVFYMTPLLILDP